MPLTVLEQKIVELIESVVKEGEGKEKEAVKPTADFLSEMTFALPAWCKCCTVPGSCEEQK